MNTGKLKLVVSPVALAELVCVTSFETHGNTINAKWYALKLEG
jgi:hypothetical protein